ncbi:hypothetical protein DFH07DRAFT_356254 [Mycena maculata]|uniref:Transmembrane protein n=1 Tax=Mycena maculata TaxID=230809 RepID=A0AAD7MGE1_9AGAR|nr:hypothetical protein DFH07DRAFT_356254 [Mycena maculata]
MLLLGTAQIVVQVAASTVSICFTQGLVRERTNITGGPAVAINSLINATIIIFAINNLVTDTLFLYRCYVIWDFRKKVIILPGMFLLSTFVFGVFASYTVEDNLITIAYTMATATNILLTTLTAGRIWWKRRQTSHTGLDDTFRKWYSTAVAIILESGAAYFVCGILLVSTIAIEPRGNSMIYGIVLGITRQSVVSADIPSSLL